MLGAVRDKLSEFPVLQDTFCPGGPGMGENRETLRKKIRLTQTEEEIKELLSKISGAGDVLMKYIDEKISKLDAERNALLEEIRMETPPDAADKKKQVTNHAKLWETLPLEEKQAVADILIRVIRIADGRMEIIWRI